jgi:hypothetical protein
MISNRKKEIDKAISEMNYGRENKEADITLITMEIKTIINDLGAKIDTIDLSNPFYNEVAFYLQNKEYTLGIGYENREYSINDKPELFLSNENLIDIYDSRDWRNVIKRLFQKSI